MTILQYLIAYGEFCVGEKLKIERGCYPVEYTLYFTIWNKFSKNIPQGKRMPLARQRGFNGFLIRDYPRCEASVASAFYIRCEASVASAFYLCKRSDLNTGWWNAD